MIRVVHSNPTWLAQTQTWVDTQVRFAPADRVENHVVCERTENLDQFPVAHLHDFSAAGMLERFWDRGLRRAGLRHHLGYLARVARRVGAAILHSHFGDVGWANLGAARAARCRHVVTFYGYDVSNLPRQPAWRRRFTELFRNVDRVLCEGPHMARCVVDLGCAADSVRVQHLGIPLERFPFRPRQWRPGEPLRVLIASTFTEKKGIPYAIRALGELRRHVDVRITVIGDARPESSENQRQKQEIVAAIAAQGLGDRVRMPGFMPHARLIEEAYGHHVYLCPSVTASDGATEGGAPVTLVEMAASGMLIVSTRHCDIPEVVHDGRTGLLAEERDAAGLHDRLLAAARDPQRWAEMLARGREHVESEYDARAQAERLAGHYEELLASPGISAS
jgi:colanic acid/amylovoran/stewartan biosynthesis glycosyltransferase WcaL/AmsK/CpsK